MTVINLPWPSKDLSPNARVHWAKRARAVKQARNDAAWHTLSTGVRTHDFLGVEALEVALLFIPPDSRLRDTDGMISSVKSYLDGIADVIGVDDSKFVLTIKRGPPMSPGAVRVTIVPNRVPEASQGKNS